MLDFAVTVEEQCTLEGKHEHERWPGKPLCCAHFDAADKIIRLLDHVGEEARLKWLIEAKKRIADKYLQATRKRKSEWAIRMGLKTTGTPIDG